MNADNLGAYVNYLRKQRGWSLRDLSSHTTDEFSVSYLSDIERGRTMPSIDTVRQIAAAFDMSVPVFFGGADFALAADEMRLLTAYRDGDVVEVMRLMLARVDKSPE